MAFDQLAQLALTFRLHVALLKVILSLQLNKFLDNRVYFRLGILALHCHFSAPQFEHLDVKGISVLQHKRCVALNPQPCLRSFDLALSGHA